MRRRTPRRAAEEREYTRLRIAYLASNPACVNCGHAATEIHHRRGRVGTLLTDIRNFASVCSDCHRFITEHPLWALERGLSERRIGRATT